MKQLATLLFALTLFVPRAEAAETTPDAPTAEQKEESAPRRRQIQRGPLRPREPMGDGVAAKPPPPPPPYPEPPPDTLQLKAPELRVAPPRYSALCKGPGGALYILEGFVGGLLSGTLVSSPSGDDDTVKAGAIVGGGLLGLGSLALQYGLYSTIPGGIVDGLAYFGGLAAGGAVTSLAHVPDGRVAPIVGGAGALAFLLALPLHANADITEADAMYAIGTSVYATVYTSLLAWFVRSQHGRFNGAFIGFAPLGGLAVGGITARAVALPFDRTFALVAVPLSLGAVVTVVGGLDLTFDDPAVPGAALATITAALVAVAVGQSLSEPSATESQASLPTVVPLVTAVQARGGTLPAAGLSARF